MTEPELEKSRATINESLSAGAFTALLGGLDSDPRAAAQRYEKLREKLVRLFTWRGCVDAPQLADETLNRVAKRIKRDQQVQKKIDAFVLGVAHKVYLEVLRQNRKHQHAASEIKARPTDLFAREITNPQLVKLEQCIMELPKKDRDLILAYYRHSAGSQITARKLLSKKLGLTEGNLRIKAFRIRSHLEKRLQAFTPHSETNNE